MSGRALWLADTCRAFGLTVVEVDGWQERGDDVLDELGVMCHWTALLALGDMPSLRLLINGRPDLDGPLANVGLGRSGTVYVVASGRANHAGIGIWGGVKGNSHFLGIEAEYHPAQGPWPQVQTDAYVVLTAALRHGPRHIEPPMICGHYEYALPAGRKIDPNNLNMDAIRYASGLVPVPGAAPVPPPPPPETRPTIRLGSKGQAVKDWQWYLADTTGAGLVWDGNFGPATDRATRNFQRFCGLPTDGIVGPRSWQAMDAVRSAQGKG